MSLNVNYRDLYAGLEPIRQNSSLGTYSAGLEQVRSGLQELERERASRASWSGTVKGWLGFQTDAKALSGMCRKLRQDEAQLAQASRVEQEYQRAVGLNTHKTAGSPQRLEEFRGIARPLLANPGVVPREQLQRGLEGVEKELLWRSDMDQRLSAIEKR